MGLREQIYIAAYMVVKAPKGEERISGRRCPFGHYDTNAPDHDRYCPTCGTALVPTYQPTYFSLYQLIEGAPDEEEFVWANAENPGADRETLILFSNYHHGVVAEDEEATILADLLDLKPMWYVAEFKIKHAEAIRHIEEHPNVTEVEFGFGAIRHIS